MSPPKKRSMVAGIGNVFLQDDGFGPEVIRNLLMGARCSNALVKDFGTGGSKLVYDLMPGFDALILVDAVRRGESPGTLYVIEPKPEDVSPEEVNADPHGADIATVLRLIKESGVWPRKTLLVGCEPSEVDEFEMGLSQPVRAAVVRAVALVESILAEIERTE